jgi:hypothetical protein
MANYRLLDEFIEKYSDLPEQGTDAWKALRLDFIGGSEIASVIRRNRNKTPYKLVKEKLGFDRFDGSMATHWGNVFEELIRLHCEDVFTCTIRETGSIPYKDGILSYSPDGLAVIPTLSLTDKLGEIENIDETQPTQLTLFEFKCPHSRKATNVIPEHYQPQVNIGMNIIDIMQTAVFVQAIYRRCSFRDLGYNSNYNAKGHFREFKHESNPIECGFMIFYTDEPSEDINNIIENIYSEYEIDMVEGLVDVGDLYDNYHLEDILERCAHHTMKVDYSIRETYRQNIFSESQYTIDMYDRSMQHRMNMALKRKLETIENAAFVLPFKLMSVYYTSVPKNPNYIQETDAYHKAEIVLQCIEDHRGMTDKKAVERSIRKYKL